MRIPCPYCGERDIAEFVCRGEAPTDRPDPAGPDPAGPDPSGQGAMAAFHDYVYLHANPAGEMAVHWYHASGCRNWLTVRCDTRSNTVLGAAFPDQSRTGTDRYDQPRDGQV